MPVYEDNSLATMLSQLALGQEIPDALYQAIVEIYVYFLNFDPTDPDKARRERKALAEQAESNCDREQLTAALYAMGAIPLETLLAEIPG